jgi:hypothetical protein
VSGKPFADGGMISSSTDPSALAPMTVACDPETAGLPIAGVMGEIRVWNGAGWMKLIPSGSPTGRTPSAPMPAPIEWKPAMDPEADPENTVLLEVLLCTDCGMELGTEACSPQHAYLADNPLEHGDVKPLLMSYLHEQRRDDKICVVCAIPLGHDGCRHVDSRDGQVRLSRDHWERLGEEMRTLRGLRSWLDTSEAEDKVATTMRSYAMTMSDDEGTYWQTAAKVVLDGLKRRGL